MDTKTSLSKINGNIWSFNEYLRVIENTRNNPDTRNSMQIEKPVPIKPDKIHKIAFHFKEIMEVLGLDLSDESLTDTPMRVAKMYVNEIFSGLDPENKPKIKLFSNKYNYNQMLIERNIRLHSYCEHHFLPVIGKAHVAYISNGYVIGLSKINRIVDYFARRPQLQERLTVQIAEEFKKVLHTEHVAVLIEAEHMCVTIRGIQDEGSITSTGSYHGKFLEENTKQEFLSSVYRRS